MEPECINTSRILNGKCQEIELAMDSRATETVIGEETLKNVKLLEGLAFKRCVQYEVVNGNKIQKLGEKKFSGWTAERLAR